ncbi:DUF5916 domain-containing protein [Kordia sp. SMS9]|uniref:DUF5916 domain-containing protein n=1 Tax=Kordia sp. SMS9 TaxID=2282170 RepID=UPI001F07755A|nr:DUF5916 domain-containing protein [Kordia sp. SMS9]
MNISKIILTIFMMLLFQSVWSQDKRKKYNASRTNEAPKIDGKPFENVWNKAVSGSDFIMLQPDNGAQEKKAQKSIVKILYDDNSIYVAAYLYDDNIKKIDKQFSQRDQVNVQTDVFSFWINTYNNQIDQTRFYVTAAGAIADSKATNGSEDFSYNVIFDGKSSIDENGWYVEMKIPYQALRFPKSKVQNWSFNALRRINSQNQSFTFNFVDITQGNEAQYDAQLLGITNINPPFRLSLFPYTSIQSVQFEGKSETEFNAGLDLKYGISDAFTLDATLIPDFGQVAFDEVILNLGPFEQAFQEQRPFFTEGTELFSKGNLFFSRRIGQTPTRFGEVQSETLENEIIVENPQQAQLLNAVKVTGRTKNKLGIAFLNAVTKKATAILKDTITNSQREFVTEPLTNYNLIVLDKQFGANSSVYFSTASTFRGGSFTDANVSAIGVEHFDKKNIYRYKADFKMSNRFRESDTDQGYNFEGRWDRVQGKWRYGFLHRNVGKNYNPNDLGLQFRNNLNGTYLFGSYNQFKPKGILNNFRVNYEIGHERTNSPGLHNATSLYISAAFQTKNLLNFGAYTIASTRTLDLFESRIPLQAVRYAPRIVYGGYFTTDTRKRISINAGVNTDQRFNDPENRFDFFIEPSFRITDKFFISYNWFWQKRNQRLSFVAIDNGESILSRRNTQTIENSIQGVYNFDTTKSINLRLRNFWSAAKFSDDYKVLLSDGNTQRYTENNTFNPNADFNIWNMDVSFVWQFAPASNLILLYRNSLSNFQSNGDINFTDSLNQLFQESIQQTFSVRLTYFLDVNKILPK